MTMNICKKFDNKRKIFSWEKHHLRPYKVSRKTILLGEENYPSFFKTRNYVKKCLICYRTDSFFAILTPLTLYKFTKKTRGVADLVQFGKSPFTFSDLFTGVKNGPLYRNVNIGVPRGMTQNSIRYFETKRGCQKFALSDCQKN